MNLHYSDLGNNIRLIKLEGTLDIMGVNEVETQFAGYCSGEKPLVLVDLSSVDFMASIGIRLLTTNAKSIATRGGRMALLNPSPDVKDVLEMTGIPSIIPMYENLESAQAVLMA
ncbi:MAG TPA: STAS domain-containing protein [Anaerolineales bacterium]|nr:anti-sigma factor antagonist [Anaerolineae bacterium]HRJ56454.1 STAS domain-containing protein [Anaerolineales bacterium]HRK91590.1 STAS domain-containing protein [Anaerolineales bacterium]